jgi:effector-binding domain-containing protein
MRPINAAQREDGQRLRIDIEEVETRPYPIVTVVNQCALVPSVVARSIESAFEDLRALMDERRIEAAGPPLTIFRNWSVAEITFAAAFPVSAADHAKSGGDMQADYAPGGPALRAVVVGPYEQMPDAYAGLQKETAERGFESGGVAWEVYVSGHDGQANNDAVTEIYVARAAD